MSCRQREYKIEEIVDPGIKGQHCSEAMWRVIEVASVCTEPFSTFPWRMSSESWRML
jgi:hypothetical protein